MTRFVCIEYVKAGDLVEIEPRQPSWQAGRRILKFKAFSCG